MSPGCRIARVRIYGLDFTNAPSRRKPLISVGRELEGRTLRVEYAGVLAGFEEFERFLESGEPRVCRKSVIGMRVGSWTPNCS